MIGFSIGLVFVIFFFQNRGCAWLPGNRVNLTINDKVWVITDSEKEKFSRSGIGQKEIMKIISEGKVNFPKSIKKQNSFPKAYIIEHELDNENVRLQFSLFEDSYITLIHQLDEQQEAFKTDSIKEMGTFIRLPRDSALVYIDKSDYARCTARFLSNRNQKVLVEALEKSGRIDLNKSDLSLSKATQYIHFNIGDSLNVEAKSIFLESRINFKAFFWEEFEPDC